MYFSLRIRVVVESHALSKIKPISIDNRHSLLRSGSRLTLSLLSIIVKFSKLSPFDNFLLQFLNCAHNVLLSPLD